MAETGRILVIDDSITLLSKVKERLAKDGYEILTTTNAVANTALLKGCDLVIIDFHMPGYPEGEALVPHGVSVVVGAPSAFRFTATARPERHLAAALLLGADARDGDDAGDLLGRTLEALMREARVPLGLGALGYGEGDVDALVSGTAVQTRLLDNAPRAASRDDLAAIFRAAMEPR